MKKDWTERSWSSLSSLRDFLSDSKSEKIIRFDGMFLITTKARYSLGPDGLVIKKGNYK